MTAQASAFELALALRAEPGMSVHLRLRGLPDGMSNLVRVAAGPGDFALAQAHRLGMEPDSLIELSREFMRQACFFEGASHYRVLGLDRTASADKLKQHHRWLVRWLHPDRRGAEHMFAALVNQAWDAVCIDDSRFTADIAAPDLACAQSHHPGLRVRTPVATGGRFGWVLPVGVLAACAALAWLAARQESAEVDSVGEVVAGEGSQLSPGDEAPAWAFTLTKALDLQLKADAAKAAFEASLRSRTPEPAAPRVARTLTPTTVLPPVPTPPRPIARPIPRAAEPVSTPVAVVKAAQPDPVRVPPPEIPTPEVAAISATARLPPFASIPAEAGSVATAAQPAGDVLSATEKTSLAHARMRAVQEFLRNPVLQPTHFWSDVGSRRQAELVHRALHAGSGGQPYRFGTPSGQATQDAAVVQSSYTRGRSSEVGGLLIVGMSWRNNGWQVNSLEMRSQ